MSSECQQIRELMDSYLSEELSVETNHRVLRHLTTCQACASEARQRQRLRALLAQSLHVQVNADRARQRITEALDRERSSWGQVHLRTFGASARQAARWWAAAAALLIGVVATYWLSRPVDASAYDDSAADHVLCALTYPASTMYDPARAAGNLVAPFERIAEAIGLTHGPYRVIDAHMCPYNGRDYAHVVFRSSDQTLSLFVEPAARGALPATQVTTRLPGHALAVHSTTAQGYHVSATSTSKHKLYLVSESPAGAPDDIATEILLSAVRFVRTLEP